jgi:Flp pilus assembly protein TadG
MRRKRNEKGNVYIEFVLVASFFFVPIILGMITVGIAVLRSYQVNQLTRDVGHMMAKGVDFSQQANQNLVANDLANGLSLQANSGNVTGSAPATACWCCPLLRACRLPAAASTAATSCGGSAS